MSMPYARVIVIAALLVSSCGPTDTPVPTAGPSDPDAAVLAELAKAGSDLTKAHPVRFYLYLPSKEVAVGVAGTLEKDGFRVDVRPAASGEGWLCLAEKTLVPELQALKSIGRQMESLAGPNGGEYDGWEAPIVR